MYFQFAFVSGVAQKIFLLALIFHLFWRCVSVVLFGYHDFLVFPKVFHCFLIDFLNVQWFSFILLILLILRGPGEGLDWSGAHVHILQAKIKNRREPGKRHRRQWANRSLLTGKAREVRMWDMLQNRAFAESSKKKGCPSRIADGRKPYFYVRKRMLAGWLAGVVGLGGGRWDCWEAKLLVSIYMICEMFGMWVCLCVCVCGCVSCCGCVWCHVMSCEVVSCDVTVWHAVLWCAMLWCARLLWLLQNIWCLAYCVRLHNMFCVFVFLIVYVLCFACFSECHVCEMWYVCCSGFSHVSFSLPFRSRELQGNEGRCINWELIPIREDKGTQN